MMDPKIIVVHCSDSPNERTLVTRKPGPPPVVVRTPSQEIDAWHKERGFQRDSYWRSRHEPGLSSLGYHFVIGRNGALYNGRHPEEVGAHAAGWNSVSLGICLVGRDQFTEEQLETLKNTIKALGATYDIPMQNAVFGKAGNKHTVASRGVCGHRDLPGVAKTCPGFDVGEWLTTWEQEAAK